LEERKITITSLQTELVNREIQLQQALQSISSPAVVSGENKTTEALQDEAQPKLLNPKQLAEWINKNCNTEKEIKDHNIRDWYTPRKTCEKTRLENEQKYGHKLDHKDKKGTLWFTIS